MAQQRSRSVDPLNASQKAFVRREMEIEHGVRKGSSFFFSLHQTSLLGVSMDHLAELGQDTIKSFHEHTQHEKREMQELNRRLDK